MGKGQKLPKLLSSPSQNPQLGDLHCLHIYTTTLLHTTHAKEHTPSCLPVSGLERQVNLEDRPRGNFSFEKEEPGPHLPPWWTFGVFATDSLSDVYVCDLAPKPPDFPLTAEDLQTRALHAA